MSGDLESQTERQMKNQLIPIERVQKLILLLRGEKVLLGQ